MQKSATSLSNLSIRSRGHVQRGEFNVSVQEIVSASVYYGGYCPGGAGILCVYAQGIPRFQRGVAASSGVYRGDY